MVWTGTSISSRSCSVRSRASEHEADERELDLRVELPAHPLVHVGEYQWQAIAGNLIENALAYAEPNTLVEVVLASEPGGERWQLAITNTARDLDAEDLPRLFERLWRKEAARSSELHSGLGLALAASCARQLGVEITPSLTPAGRLTMRVSGFRASPSTAPIEHDRSSALATPASAFAQAAR